MPIHSDPPNHFRQSEIGEPLFFFEWKGFFLEKNVMTSSPAVSQGDMKGFLDKPLTYAEIAESPLFRDFFALVAGLMGVPVRLMDDAGRMEMRHRHEKKRDLFCDVIRRSEKTNKLCQECDRRHASLAVKRKTGFAYRCHAGLYDVVVPVFDRETHVATLITGRLLAEAHSEKKFSDFYRRFSHHSFDESELRKAYTATSFASEEKVQALAGLLQFFSTHVHEVRLTLKSLSGVKTRLEIAQAQSYVRDHLGETIYLSEVCREIGLSPSHFSTIFRKETGLKFFDYVNRLRVAEAKKLLERTSASILEVALTCGFETLSHFNRVYRKLENQSPAELRR